MPPPVGAISSTLSPERAASSMASWCRRGVQPWAANQPANGSGNVPSIALFYWLWRSAGSGATFNPHAASLDLAEGAVARALLRARRLLHRSAAGRGPCGHHPRPFRPRAPGTSRRAGERRHTGTGDSPVRRGARRGDPTVADLGREASDWRRAAVAAAGRTRAGQRPGGDGIRGHAGGRQRGLQAHCRPDLRGLRADPLRRVRDRGDVRAAGVPPSPAGAGDRPAAGECRAVPGADACRRLLCARQVPAADRLVAPGGLGRTRSGCTARLSHSARSTRRGAWRSAICGQPPLRRRAN